mmetsp:Transcript_37453/g.105755  ORF Transcript_37453/g.105755 Transcript_37453/m.105755 type:complete len:596 (+) Transcript_37453:169-1956(+)
MAGLGAPTGSSDRRAAASFLFLSALLMAADGAEVLLTALTIYDTHDRFVSPEVYLRCHGDRQEHMLDDVKEADKRYTWQPGMLLLTLEDGKCADCGLYEKDHLPGDKDDIFGEFRLCPTDFRGEEAGQMNVFRPGEFLATFECSGCVAPPPPPSPPPPSAPPAPAPAATTEPRTVFEPSPSSRWRFVSSEWAGDGSTIWEVVIGRVFASEDCNGEPLPVEEVEYIKCCGGGPWRSQVQTDSSEEVGDGSSQDPEGGAKGSSQEDSTSSEEEGNSSEGGWREGLEPWDEDGPFHKEVSYTVKDGQGCKDFTHWFLAETDVATCQARCSSWPGCAAYTFNALHSKCYLKESCLDLQVDTGGHDVSGIKEGQASGEVLDAINREEQAQVDTAGQEEVHHWNFHTRFVADHREGGAYVSFRLPEPAIVQCMQFVTSLDNTTHFPSAGRIEFFVEVVGSGGEWRAGQQLSYIGQEKEAVKLISARVDVASISNHTIVSRPASRKSSSSRPSSMMVMVLTVTAVLLSAICFILGLSGLSGYQRMQRRRSEHYQRRFEVVFDSPDFEELDRIVEEDQQSFLASLGDWRNWSRGGRYHPFTHS